MFEQLMKDAQPKADTIAKATTTLTNKVQSVAHNVVKSNAVQSTKSFAYSGLVNTVGVSLVLAQPVVTKSKSLLSGLWNRVEKLAQEAK